MRFSFVVASILAVFASAASHAEENVSRSGHPLLVIQGLNMKWGAPTRGTPATVRYAFADTQIARPEGRNCRSISPFPARLNGDELPFGDVVAEIHAAFDAWQAVTNVTFEYVDDAARADIVIGTQTEPRGIAFADIVYEVPRASQSGSLASISKAAICFNPTVRWETGFDQNRKTYDVRYVATHEIGHALGLDHAWGRSDTIMSFRYRERVRSPQLVDIAGAQFLYGVLHTQAASNVQAGQNSGRD